jgi:hypothetical protein
MRRYYRLRKLFKGENTMVSYTEAASRVNYDLILFLENIGCNSLKFQVLQFWGRHPQAKMTFCAMAAGLGTPKNLLGFAIAELMEKGILNMQFRENGLITYGLTEERETRTYIEELALLDRNETRNLARVMDMHPLSGSPEGDQSVFYHLLSMS